MVWIYIGVMIYTIGFLLAWGFLDASTSIEQRSNFRMFFWLLIWPIGLVFSIGCAVGEVYMQQLKREQYLKERRRERNEES